jgi:hypothetical protein
LFTLWTSLVVDYSHLRGPPATPFEWQIRNELLSYSIQDGVSPLKKFRLTGLGQLYGTEVQQVNIGMAGEGRMHIDKNGFLLWLP